MEGNFSDADDAEASQARYLFQAQARGFGDGINGLPNSQCTILQNAENASDFLLQESNRAHTQKQQ